ncbi:MAG: hypothetical protein OXC41_03545 [Gammaproteobacteria bacterium]|nr:hypothetical protein [Gammaproteobacteria bacterium]
MTDEAICTGVFGIEKHTVGYTCYKTQENAHLEGNCSFAEFVGGCVEEDPAVLEAIKKGETCGHIYCGWREEPHPLVECQVDWEILKEEEEYDEFQRGVETVLIEFVKRADEVLENKDVALEMVIPIKDVQKFRDAVDTARDVLFG